MDEEGREPPVHRVRHLLSGVNLRQTQFVDDVPYYHTCSLCKVIPRRTLLLPCSHVLCESCHKGSLQEEEEEEGCVSGVCPLDEQTFQVRQCARIKMSATKMNNLQAYCWNKEQGCEFVGALRDVLVHCEEECTFHAFACPRCGESVLHADLPAHYRAGCEDSSATEDAEEASGNDDEAAAGHGDFNLEDVMALLEQLEVLDTETVEL